MDLTIVNGDVALAASVFGALDAPPVLLLHGIGNARDGWFDWAQRLADRARVYTLDFRGHGHSSHATRYHLADYVADAEAVLAHIAEPTLVVGHSLGGLVAGRLAQHGHPLVRRALLVDPAWFFGVPAEFARTIYPQRFAGLAGLMTRLREEGAPLPTWVRALAESPHPWGGRVGDHTPPHLVAAHASALRRQDPACWSTPVEATFGGFDPLAPFRCPTRILRADERYGAALLGDQAARLQAVTPSLALTWYDGSDHSPQRTYRFAARFGADLAGFVAAG